MNDFPYSGGIALMFSALEPCLLVTAACIPLLRPLVSRNDSTNKSSNYARSSSKNKIGASSTPWTELPDDDGSTRQLHVGQSQYGGGATAAADGSAFNSSYGAENHHTNVELKTITVKRDWRVEESAV